MDHTHYSCSRFLLYGLLLGSAYILFAWQHIHLSEIFSKTLVFGDDGDGFFNLWVLDHNRQHFFSGLREWMNGKIFYPSHQKTILWSDLLLFPTIPYSFFHMLGFERFTAYRLTIFLFTFIHFLLTFVILNRLRHWVSTTPSSSPPPGRLLTLSFTLAIVFSMNLIVGYQHFQTHSWIGVVLIVFAACGFGITSQGWYLGLAAASGASLLFTAPYYAVIGLILFCAWLPLYYLHAGNKAIPSILRHWKIWLPISLSGLIPIILYCQVQHTDYPLEAIYGGTATRLTDFFVPPHGVLRNLLDLKQISLPLTRHESPAYIGLGFFLLLLAYPLLRRQKTDNCKDDRQVFLKRFALLILAYLLYRLLREVGVAGYFMAWAVLFSFAFFLQPYFSAKRLHTARGFLSSVLLLSTLLCMGFAIGPNPYFLDQSVNPSFYGLLEKTFPGVSKMRAIGRMSSLGFVFLGIWLFLQYTTALSRKNDRLRVVLSLVLAVALTLQLAESWPVRAVANNYNLSAFVPEADEARLLQKVKGPTAVFPSTPWCINTHAMIYFSQFEDIILINGYSAKSSPFFNKLMAAGNGAREPTDQQLSYLQEVKCQNIIVSFRRVSKPIYEKLSKRYTLMGKTKKIAVFSEK